MRIRRKVRVHVERVVLALQVHDYLKLWSEWRFSCSLGNAILATAVSIAL